jgi:hypothetical protein
MSTYMPLAKEGPLLSDANKATPILQCHGSADFTVNFEFGQQTHKLLQVAAGLLGAGLLAPRGVPAGRGKSEAGAAAAGGRWVSRGRAKLLGACTLRSRGSCCS